jgi:hypothetical protein
VKKALLLLILSSSLLTCFAQSWSTLGSGITSQYGTVYALTSYQGNLIAGGYFDTAGGVQTNYIAQWNGSLWDSLAGGFGRYPCAPLTCPSVDAFTTYRGNLVVGGQYGQSEWNGTTWFDSCGDVQLSSNSNWPETFVGAFTIYHGNLITAGYFNEAYLHLYSNTIYPRNIVQCSDTTLSVLGNGIATYGEIRALTVYNNYLIAGGSFDSAGNIKTHNIAAWSDTWNMWYPLGKGINGTVNALTVYNGYLIAGGSFDSAGGMPANNIAMWDGSSWRPIGQGVNGPVYSLTPYNNYLVIGGKFTMAGGNPANNIAEWLNNRWFTLGAGTSNTVNAMTVYNGNLIVGGYFDTAGGIPSNKIAQWTQPLGVNEIQSENAEVKLYPNPNSGAFKLQVIPIAIGNEKLKVNSVVEIYNVLGEKVYSTQYSHLTTQISIDISNQPSGIYMYRVITETGNLVSTGKFVIQK